MKAKKKILIVILLFATSALKAQIYIGKICEIIFFSYAPIENISAKNISAKPILNTSSNDIEIKITIKGFGFEKKLMEEHFNEKYLESDTYPYATFSGKIKDIIDYEKEGAYKVTVMGKLNLHGVEKERTLEGALVVKDGEISIETKFMIALKDHKIKIPSLVAQNIAETVEVTMKSTLTKFKSPQ